jgi:hypothetical protein
LTFHESGDEITLTMTRADYDYLSLACGYILGMLELGSPAFYGFLDFINELNKGNWNYTPYDVPPEYRGRRGDIMEILKSRANA